MAASLIAILFDVNQVYHLFQNIPLLSSLAYYVLNYKWTSWLSLDYFLSEEIPRWLSSKESVFIVTEDMGSIPVSRKITLEKEMTICFSIRPEEIPWTEGPGRLLSMGSQRSRTQLSD